MKGKAGGWQTVDRKRQRTCQPVPTLQCLLLNRDMKIEDVMKCFELVKTTIVSFGTSNVLPKVVTDSSSHLLADAIFQHPSNNRQKFVQSTFSSVKLTSLFYYFLITNSRGPLEVRRIDQIHKGLVKHCGKIATLGLYTTGAKLCQLFHTPETDSGESKIPLKLLFPLRFGWLDDEAGDLSVGSVLGLDTTEESVHMNNDAVTEPIQDKQTNKEFVLGDGDEDRLRVTRLHYPTIKRNTITELTCNYQMTLSHFPLPTEDEIYELMFNKSAEVEHSDTLKRFVFYISCGQCPSIPMQPDVHPFSLILSGKRDDTEVDDCYGAVPRISEHNSNTEDNTGRVDTSPNSNSKTGSDVNSDTWADGDGDAVYCVPSKRRPPVVGRVPDAANPATTAGRTMSIRELTPWSEVVSTLILLITVRAFTSEFRCNLNLVRDHLVSGKRYPGIVLKALGVYPQHSQQNVAGRDAPASDGYYTNHSAQDFKATISYITYRHLQLGDVSESNTNPKEKGLIDDSSQDAELNAILPSGYRLIGIASLESKQRVQRIHIRCGELLKLVAPVSIQKGSDVNLSKYSDDRNNVLACPKGLIDGCTTLNTPTHLISFDCLCIGSDLCIIREDIYKLILPLFRVGDAFDYYTKCAHLICVNSENYSQNLRVWRSVIDYLPRDTITLQRQLSENFFSVYNIYNTLSTICRTEATRQGKVSPLYSIYRTIMEHSKLAEPAAKLKERKMKTRDRKGVNVYQFHFIRYALKKAWSIWGNVNPDALVERTKAHKHNNTGCLETNKEVSKGKDTEKVGGSKNGASVAKQSEIQRTKPMHPLLLVGPPGTGKTKTLAEMLRLLARGTSGNELSLADGYKTLNRIERDAENAPSLLKVKEYLNSTLTPSIVLCLCATNSGVDQLVERIVGESNNYNPSVSKMLGAAESTLHNGVITAEKAEGNYTIPRLPYYLPPFIQVECSIKSIANNIVDTNVLMFPLGRIVITQHNTAVSSYRQIATSYLESRFNKASAGNVVSSTNSVTDELGLMAFQQAAQMFKAKNIKAKAPSRKVAKLIERTFQDASDSVVNSIGASVLALRIGSCGYSNSTADISKEIKRADANKRDAKDTDSGTTPLQAPGTLFPWIHMDVMGKEVAVCWISDGVIRRNYDSIVGFPAFSPTPYVLHVPLSRVPCSFILWCAACIRWAHKQMGSLEKEKDTQGDAISREKEKEMVMRKELEEIRTFYPRGNQQTKQLPKNEIVKALSRRIGAKELVNSLIPWRVVRNSTMSETQSRGLDPTVTASIPTIRLLRNFLLRLGLSSKNFNVETLEAKMASDGMTAIDINPLTGTISTDNSYDNPTKTDRFMYPDSYGSAVLQLIENEVFGVSKTSYIPQEPSRDGRENNLNNNNNNEKDKENSPSKTIVQRGPLEHILLVQPEYGDNGEDPEAQFRRFLSDAAMGPNKSFKRSSMRLQSTPFNFPLSSLDIRTVATRFDFFSLWRIRSTSDSCTNDIRRNTPMPLGSFGQESTKYISSVVHPYKNPSPVLILGCTIGSLIPFAELIENDVVQIISAFNMRQKDMSRDHQPGADRNAPTNDNENRMVMFASRDPSAENKGKLSSTSTKLTFTNRLNSSSSISPTFISKLIAKNILPISFVLLEEAGLTAEPDTLHAINVCSLHNEAIRNAYASAEEKQGLMAPLFDKTENLFIRNLAAPMFIFSGDPMQLSPFSYGKLGSLRTDTLMTNFINQLITTNEQRQKEAGASSSFILPQQDIKGMYGRIYRSLVEESTMERMIRFNALIMEQTQPTGAAQGQTKLTPPFPTFFLQKQYRMHKEIALFPTKEFYGNIVEAKRSGEGPTPRPTLLNNLLIYRSPNSTLAKQPKVQKQKRDDITTLSHPPVEGQCEEQGQQSHSVFGPYVLFNLSSTESRVRQPTNNNRDGAKKNSLDFSGLSKSVYNEEECQFIVSYLILLFRLHPYLCNDGVDMSRTQRDNNGLKGSSNADIESGSGFSYIPPIAVITPYAAQRKRLAELWNKTVCELYNEGASGGTTPIDNEVKTLTDYRLWKSKPLITQANDNTTFHPLTNYSVRDTKTSKEPTEEDVVTVSETETSISSDNSSNDNSHITSITKPSFQTSNIFKRYEVGLLRYLPGDILLLRYKNIFNFLYSRDWKDEVAAMDFNTTLRYDYYDKYIDDFKKSSGDPSFPLPIPIQYQQLLRAVSFSTVDGFQGQERGIIIVSLVRANARGELGFVASRKRMNSALTRAKHSMVVVGNFTSLCRSLDEDDSDTFPSRPSLNTRGEDSSLEDAEDYDPFIITRLFKDGRRRGVVADVTNNSLPDYSAYSKTCFSELTDNQVGADVTRLKEFIKLI